MLTTQSTSIQFLLSAGRQYITPPHGRGYTWEVSQLKFFWEDLSSHSQSFSEMQGPFMGTMILQSPKDSDGTRWIIVDGQNRLMTAMVGLCAIRDHFPDLFVDIGCDIIPLEADRAALHAITEGRRDAMSASTSITRAYDFFRKQVATLDRDTAANVARVILSCPVVAFEVDDDFSSRVLSRFYDYDPRTLRSLIIDDESASDVIALANRRKQVGIFRRYLEDDDYFLQEASRLSDSGKKELVWQKFFERNPWILGASLAGQLLTSWNPTQLEQIVAGASVAGSGKRVDALLRTSGVIKSMVLAEIKTHDTPLLQREYRSGCWGPSEHLAGGIVQLQGTVYRAIQSIGEQLHDRDDDGADIPGADTYLIRPKSYLVIGQLSSLLGQSGGVHADKLRSFELFRRHIIEPEIVTFDELLARAEAIAGIKPL
ncbi:uncharacterized protein DUF262 [Nonomuraea fuscirosea]|uniref:Uncharacterized protein DUF262 n=1 Tax=Nonomuraea fuscirosea TaxID=1291556 RepID=A0A2T0MSH0_9ACTN|nr:Shedu anti-phage system protein SduA domain-containing protein [Nonomuraea fuscirosea]PRX61436.1 uncharacterized protein DUF262 [Nonomuraea fuscirosea]